MCSSICISQYELQTLKLTTMPHHPVTNKKHLKGWGSGKTKVNRYVCTFAKHHAYNPTYMHNLTLGDSSNHGLFIIVY